MSRVQVGMKVDNFKWFIVPYCYVRGVVTAPYTGDLLGVSKDVVSQPALWCGLHIDEHNGANRPGRPAAQYM